MSDKIFDRRVLKLGDSLAITIPSKIVQELDLNENDSVFVSINKDIEMVEYRCKACSYVYAITPGIDDIFCPCCGQEGEDFNSLNESVNKMKGGVK